jgi:filamentous hemagglutinin
MNKQFYRTKFNAKLGTYVAVSELAKSHQGDTSPRIKASIHSNNDVSETSIAATGQRTLKQLVLALSALMAISPIYANVVVNNNAAAAHKATVLKEGNAANVWITAPSASGVSRNSYTQFDVNQNGVILNNSRGAATSQITKTSIAANPNLAKGAATTIVNEVVSSNPSLLQGNLEVLGSRANVVIANPTGITVNGGGFINANQVTLSTGVLGYNSDGSIKDHTVKQGAITINPDVNNRGLGGNANNPVALELLGRSIAINAPVNATTITAVTGANTIAADTGAFTATTGTGTKPTVAIDVAQLGGLYANSIYLYANEAGVGVNNAGIIQALNNVVLNSNGKIEHKGTISSTSKTQGLVSISTTGTGVAGDINSSGSINSNSIINIDSGNNLNVNAKEIMVNLGGVTASPLLINVKGNLNLAANSRIFNDSQSGELYVDAANINLATNSGITSNRGSAYIQSQKDIIAAQGARLVAAQDLNVSGKGKLALTGNTLQASLGSVNLEVDSSNTQGLIDIQAGTIYAGKDLNLYSTGDINLKNLGLAVENSASRVKNIKAYSGQNLKWDNAGIMLPQITGKVQLDAANQLDLIGGTISNKDDITLQANKINLGTALSSQKNINIVSKVSDLNLDKAITAQGNINVSSMAGSITSNSLKATSAGKISILANKNINVNSNQDIYSMASYDVITTDRTNIDGVKGILLGSVGDGKVNIFSSDLNSTQGDISIVSGSGVKISSNTDVSMHNDDNGRSFFSPNSFKAQNINIDNKGGDLFVDNTQFKNMMGGLLINSGGKLNINTSKLESEANIEINANGGMDLASTKINSAHHTALSTKGNINISDLENPSTKGIFSLKSDGDINLKNSKLNAGAVLIEANSFNPNEVEIITDVPFLIFDPKEQQAHDILWNKSKLSPLLGSISIQTNKDLIIDPKKIQFQKYGWGSFDLISKSGDLKILGYSGRGERDYFRVVTDGVVQLQGRNVDLQSVSLTTSKLTTGDTNIVATDGNIKIRGIKENFTGPDRIKNTSWLLDTSWKDAVTNGVIHNVSSIFTERNLNLSAKKGISINGSTLGAENQLNIQAQGPLDEVYKSTAVKNGDSAKTLGASIIVDANVNVFERGKDTDANYSYQEEIQASRLTGHKGVNIRAMGTSVNDNIVMQGVDITSYSGDVNIEADRSILFDVAVESGYDRATRTEVKRSWYGKKKVYTTTATGDVITPASVDIEGKNINILSKFKHPTRPETSIDMYSSRLTANGGKINVQSGGNINLLSVPEIRNTNVNTVKKSSWLGVTLNTSTSNATRNQATQIPAKLTADYIGTKSGYDTRLDGTEFTYLKGAHIEAGGTITFNPIVDRVEQAVKKESNSVVWQSMQDKGSITETAKLPSFNGPVTPTFIANGGLTVQVPVVSGQNNDVRAEVIKLSNQPGNEYLKGLIARKDVNWEAVKLAQENWDYKQQGLTGAGAAIIAIIVVAATAGAGATAVGALGGTASTLGGSAVAMTQAAITTLATQASVSLINNGGDITKTLNELGSKESVRGLATSIVTAGLLSQVSTALNLKPDSTYFPDRLMNNFTSSIGSTLVQTAINGGNLQDNLQKALLAGLAGALQGELASQIGNSLDKVDPNTFEYVLHKVAHAAAGCAAAAATKASCEAGAIGAGVGEIVAGLMPDPANGIEYTDAEKLKIRNIGKLVSGTVAAYAGYDVNTAANSADTAIQNNSLVKLATTTGKVLVKTLDEFNALRKAGKQVTKDDIVASLKKQSADELIGIADDLLAVFGRGTSSFDRALAAIDLIVGTDLKPGKGDSLKLAKTELDKLKTDRSFVQTVYQNKVDVITRNRLNGKEFETSAASKLGIQRNTDRQMITVKTERDGQINIIPDAFGNGGTLVEFKNVKYLSDTKQLRGYEATKKPIELVVNMDTVVTKTVRDNILANGGRIQRFNSKTQTVHPY